jgi:hypothetical protein
VDADQVQVIEVDRRLAVDAGDGCPDQANRQGGDLGV